MKCGHEADKYLEPLREIKFGDDALKKVSTFILLHEHVYGITLDEPTPWLGTCQKQHRSNGIDCPLIYISTFETNLDLNSLVRHGLRPHSLLDPASDRESHWYRSQQESTRQSALPWRRRQFYHYSMV